MPHSCTRNCKRKPEREREREMGRERSEVVGVALPIFLRKSAATLTGQVQTNRLLVVSPPLSFFLFTPRLHTHVLTAFRAQSEH